MFVLREYEITNKHFSISFDNASANAATIDMFCGKFLLSHLQMAQKFFMLDAYVIIIILIVQVGMLHINPFVYIINF